jgi:hypothetical protein
MGISNLTTEGLEVPAHAQIGEEGQLMNGGEWATTFQFHQIIDMTNLHDQLEEHIHSKNLRRPTKSLPTTWYSHSNNNA